MRDIVVWKLVGAIEHGNENQRYDLLLSAHVAASGALPTSVKKTESTVENWKKPL